MSWRGLLGMWCVPELAKVCALSVQSGPVRVHQMSQLGIDSMAMPPILKFGSDYVKQKVCRAVFTGQKSICLCISEPGAGSDVSNIQTSAKREGDFYIVSGSKKWITGGLFGDFFTVHSLLAFLIWLYLCSCDYCFALHCAQVAVRTGGEGFGGISLLLLERDMPGISIRKMETQFDNAHSTTCVVKPC